MRNGYFNASAFCKELHSSIQHKMQYLQFAEPSCYLSLLRKAAEKKNLQAGKRIHAHLILQNLIQNGNLGNALVSMYAKCGRLDNAKSVFEQMNSKDVVSWTVMISAYAKNGAALEAIYLFRQMHLQTSNSDSKTQNAKPNHFTFTSTLSACSKMAALGFGREIHQLLIRNGYHSHVAVCNALLDMYAKNGEILSARKVFDNMSDRDVVSWTAMVCCYVQNGKVLEAQKLFEIMPKRDTVTWNAIISGLVSSGNLDEAFRVFERMPERNTASWNAMILGFSQAGFPRKALHLFEIMPMHDAFTWNTIIAGLTRNGYVDQAYRVFCRIPVRDVFSWNAMISGYAQNGLLDNAKRLFDRMPPEFRNAVSYNAIVAGCVQNGQAGDALKYFDRMHQQAGLKPDEKIYPLVLAACANLANLQKGIEIHRMVIRCGLEHDVVITNALIDMYAKCGHINQARMLFENLSTKTIVSWTAMIGGYALHGQSREAIMLFETMKSAGMVPNAVTFVGVLFACSHAGLVEAGFSYFDCMRTVYGIKPTIEHHRCIVDLLSTAGMLDQAFNFINHEILQPDAATWRSLLSACSVHKNVELAEKVADRIFDLRPQDSSSYVLLLNVYAAAGMPSSVARVLKLMDDRGISKKTGCSWIYVNMQRHVFVAGDRSHSQCNEIYDLLAKLHQEMGLEGYAPKTEYISINGKEHEKADFVKHHSERLAIAFGLLNTPTGTALRVINGMRMCDDCHTAIKLMANMIGREITVRDPNLFHHFQGGQCSCND